MYYTIYQITNNVNGKIYIGAHQTENLDDGYMGSGYLIRYAIKKYGIDSFTKEILFMCENKQDMFDKEREIVTEEFIVLKTNYNIRIGGQGGAHSRNNDPEYQELKRSLTKQFFIDNPEARVLKRNLIIQNREKVLEGHKQYRLSEKFTPSFKNKHHTLTTKQLMSDMKKGSGCGIRNSQYGTCWITHPDTFENKKIKTTEITYYISLGWIQGRKIKK